jgi:UDP-N-acetylmuramate dehydrogenase
MVDIREHVPLVSLTTMQVGGPARYFAQWRSTDQLQEALGWVQARSLPVWLLSGGSNVLVPDAGLPGLVLQAAPAPLQVLDETDQNVLVYAPAGLPWQTLVQTAVDNGWQGLECLTGIPGLCGAAPIQNIGAYGQEVAAVTEWVETLDRQTGHLQRLTTPDCQFAYRDSRWKRHPNQAVVTGLALRLHKHTPPCIRYEQVRLALQAQSNTTPTLTDVARVVETLRRAKSMWLDPADSDSRSCGSFFVNPIVDQSTALQAATHLQQAGEQPPLWPQPDGQVKLSAAWLIERSGMAKGYGDGPVGLSRSHTLALVNRGGATCADVLAFAAHVQQRVADACGIALEREPVLLG